MSTVTDLIRQHALEAVGVREVTRCVMPSLDELKVTEWSPRFEELMRNRLIMGAFRYGRLGARGKGCWLRVSGAIARLERYLMTGNQELLVDAANLCLNEFVEGDGWWASVDDGEHVTRGWV
jgi:hypothetical protein